MSADADDTDDTDAAADTGPAADAGGDGGEEPAEGDANPRGYVDVSGSGPPEIDDAPGPWDNLVNRAILVLPWVAIVVVGGWLALTGRVTTEVRIEGAVSPAPLVYGVAALLGGTYVLALAKFYGVAPVTYVVDRADSFLTKYNNGRR